ncbi:unnamed protein product [Miscanthus lutarioriparius]|uniref:F-box/LRR-repeat protein 15/At3g58940/PEG3-like LRR domain-containing protein n=1 Tax=Miscanthus lutarioriparius TaxID=422564 RepID=A0A811R084_9POAL|nr:unnamed protein product [Miscanthus lutarioriparius]
MGVRSRGSNPKRPRAATVSVGDGDGNGGGGGDVDLISSLNDDLILRILDLVPEAENVVRTHALSRRWRGLWTGVAALRFDFDSRRKLCRSDAAAERYIAFVNGALALRATAAKEPAFVEDLAISFDIDKLSEQLVPLSVEAAQGWIRYAVQHAVKSLIFKLTLPWRPFVERPVMTLDERDSYADTEIMHLKLAGAELWLPSSTVVFSSLTDLSLVDIVVPAGGGHLLSRILSSACCPRLHKFWLQRVLWTTEELLLIESDTLLELSLKAIFKLQFLELRTPSLRALCVENCFDLDLFMVSAPRLENLIAMCSAKRPFRRIDVHCHLSSVETLKIQLFSRGGTETGYNEDVNDGSIHLLQCCRSTRCLEVSFKVSEAKYNTVDIIKGRILLLPHVTHLAVYIELWERHSTGPGVACLLAQCSNIKYLSLQLRYIITKENRSELDFLCDNNSCHWKSREFLLAHLQEVEFKKLMGTDCEFQFIQSILTKATGIQKAYPRTSSDAMNELTCETLSVASYTCGRVWCIFRICGPVLRWCARHPVSLARRRDPTMAAAVQPHGRLQRRERARGRELRRQALAGG